MQSDPLYEQMLRVSGGKSNMRDNVKPDRFRIMERCIKCVDHSAL